MRFGIRSCSHSSRTVEFHADAAASLRVRITKALFDVDDKNGFLVVEAHGFPGEWMPTSYPFSNTMIAVHPFATPEQARKWFADAALAADRGAYFHAAICNIARFVIE